MKIRPSLVWIHRVNTSLALLLLATGLLHTFPDVRRSLMGGYELVIADTHLWTGALFIVFPLLVLACSQKSMVHHLRGRMFKAERWNWRRINLTFSVHVCVFQAIAGFLIWSDNYFTYPVLLVDGLFLLHQGGAWYIGLLIPLHLWMARRAIIRTLRRWRRQILPTAVDKPEGIYRRDNPVSSLDSR